MKRLMCTLLILSAASAAADKKFLATVGSKDLTTETKLRGEVIWLDQPLQVGDEQMVASSDVNELTTIMFNNFGTAFGVFKSTGQAPFYIPISAEGMGNEGNFEYGGWPYIISQGRVMGISEGILKFYWNKLGPNKLSKDRLIPTLQWGAGGVVGQTAASYLLHLNVATAVGMGIVAAAGKYVYNVRDDLWQKSHYELGYNPNWFTRPVAKNIERYEIIRAVPGIPADVKLYFVGGGSKRMSELVNDKKIRYRNRNCIQLLQEIRGADGKL